MPTVKLPDGASIFYRDDSFADPWRNNVETVMMLHGFCRNSNFWYAWVPWLARDYRVIRWDARGIADSSKPEPGYPWTLERYGQDVVEFLDALGIEKAHFVGESMGGMVLPYLANWYPGRVSSITAVSSHLGIRGTVGNDMAAGSSSMAEAIRKMTREEHARATEDGRLHPEEVPQGMRDWYVQDWLRTPKQTWEEWSEVLVPQIDLTPEIFKNVACPVLYIGASGSARASQDEAKEWVQDIPDARIKTVQSRSQGIAMAKADECAEATLAFLRSLKGQAAEARLA